ncbi:hypothetical protein Btru_065141 [Bulinus truncatus]|nr:hypothetical protein Btru_065141 [Bulinus truncatus]
MCFEGSQCDLEAYGCDEGWTNHGEYCYLVVASTGDADKAKLNCQGSDSSLASVWNQDEKDFLTSMWRFPASQVGFMWLGLRGTVDGLWNYNDGSVFPTSQAGGVWSLFTGLSGVPLASPQKCVALRNSGTVAFLDCTLDAEAYVCKKALPKVFVTSSILNHSSPVPTSPLGHAQLFERMFPPVLKTLPGSSSYLADSTVTTEVGCAFRCFSLSRCQVFQVSCNTSKNCEDFKCTLFSDLTLG